MISYTHLELADLGGECDLALVRFFVSSFLSLITGLSTTSTLRYPPSEGACHCASCIRWDLRVREIERKGIVSTLRGVENY